MADELAGSGPCRRTAREVHEKRLFEVSSGQNARRETEQRRLGRGAMVTGLGGGSRDVDGLVLLQQLVEQELVHQLVLTLPIAFLVLLVVASLTTAREMPMHVGEGVLDRRLVLQSCSRNGRGRRTLLPCIEKAALLRPPGRADLRQHAPARRVATNCLLRAHEVDHARTDRQLRQKLILIRSLLWVVVLPINLRRREGKHSPATALL